MNPQLVRLAASPRRESLRHYWRSALVPEAGPDAHVFYSSGRIVPHKNQQRIVRAFLEATQAFPDAWLLLVGPLDDARYLASVRRELAGNSPASRRVIIAGPRPLAAAHLAGDTLVHAATSEALGRVIDEAFVMGNPTIVPALPTTAEKAGFAWREISNRKTTISCRYSPRFEFSPTGDPSEERSLLVDPLDVAEISAAMRRAESDSTWRISCRRFNFRTAAKFDWAECVPRFLEIWNQAEQRANGRPAFPEST